MAASGEPSGVRIGDAERDHAMTALADHLAAGRLDMDEYQQRLDSASSARTQGDLDRLFADLPGEGRVPSVRPTSEVERPHRYDVRDWLVASSGALATLAFFVCGFAFGGWAWAWVFFLLPGIVHKLPGSHDRGC